MQQYATSITNRTLQMIWTAFRGSTVKNIAQCTLLSAAAVLFVCAIPLRQGLATGSAMTNVGPDQLIVLFDPSNKASPTPEEILADVNSAGGRSSLPAELGSPIAAERLLDPVSPELASLFASYPQSPRALLQSYVLLTYADAAAMSSAQGLLSSDSRVMSVEPNEWSMRFSAAPNDQYYAAGSIPPNPTQYQWGMETMNMPQAWDLAWGHSYIAAIDTGIPCTANCTTTSHPDLLPNFRPQFSRAFVTGQLATNFDDPYGHGTHVSGIVAAIPEIGSFSNHQPNSGVAGVCWTCSYSMIRTDLSDQSIVKAWTWVADHGLQAVNMSWGDEYSYTSNCRQSPPDNRAICRAIAYAAERDVVLVGASGNGYRNRVQWPAREPSVIAVGGAQYGGGFWRDGYGYDIHTGGEYDCTPGQPGPECGSNYGPEQQIVAPAMDIISTIGLEYNLPVHCADSFGPPGIDGYGDCTGTSMAAPHVTGLVGLLRSIDPLRSKEQVKSTLISNTTPCTGVDSSKCGNGLPDAHAAIQAAFGDQNAVNRLTPLFSFYSSIAQDHFYTTIPQMALAALSPQQLIPQPIGGAISYDSIGISVPEYTEFPTPACLVIPCIAYDSPEASVSIFSSHVNPIDGTLLAPLYRYSYACKSTSGSFCSSHPYDTSHVYASNLVENWIGQGYQYDGIEGYIYPPTITQPVGTTKLCRAYDPSRNDWVLFPGAGANGLDCSAVSDGFTGGNYNQTHGSLGWVYSVRAPQAICTGGTICGTDLVVTKSHSGNFVQGQIGAVYSIVIHNSGNHPSSGTVSVVDLLPVGLTATAIGGAGWTCTLGSLSCVRGDSLAVGATYPTIFVTVNVAINAPTSVVNSVSVSGGSDVVASNNAFSDATAIGPCTNATCAPDLTIVKSHTGNFMRGQFGAAYSIVVHNSGAQPTTAAVSVVDNLPSGLTATAISGTGWTCTLSSLSCSRTSVLAAGADFPPVNVIVDVATNAPSSVNNSATTSGGGEIFSINDTTSDPTTIVACTNATCAPDLTIVKSHTGNFMRGQVGAAYSIVVHNSGARPTTAAVSVVDNLPSGLTATAISGTGWTCTLSSLSCSRTSVLAAGADFPPVNVIVDVAANAPSSVNNSATTSGGGEIFSINDTTSDPTTIVACTNATCAPDLTIVKSHTGNFMRGQVGAAYSIVVHNSGARPTTAAVSVTDNLPSGLTATAISGTGWTCTLSSLSCSRTSVLAAGADFPPVNVIVDVATNAPSSVNNSATTSGGGEIFSINDTTSDPTTIVACTNATCAPDLTIVKSHTGNFMRGQIGAAYSIVIHNSGAQPTTGMVSVVDNLPSGLTATAISGTGWTCTLSSLSCSRNSALAAGADFPPISVTVNVDTNAPSTVYNSATVSGGGEIFGINDTTSDPTIIVDF